MLRDSRRFVDGGPLGGEYLALPRVHRSGRRRSLRRPPFLGRVLACLCFLPNRFLSSLWATVNVQLSSPHPFSAGSLRYLFATLSIIESAPQEPQSGPRHCPPQPPSRSRRATGESALLHDFFAPGGILSVSLASSTARPVRYGSRHREGVPRKRHLTSKWNRHWKDLAYLLPALRMARERQQRIIISTVPRTFRNSSSSRTSPSRIPPWTAQGLLHEGSQQLSLSAQAVRPPRFPLLNGLEEIEQFHSMIAWRRLRKPAIGQN